jgi:hypothetical protein
MFTRRNALIGMATTPLLPEILRSAEAATVEWPSVGRPPAPLPKLRIVPIDPRKRTTTIKGGGDEDLLLVLPAGVCVGAFQVMVDGFRGVYLIGGDVRIQPWGTLRSPNGRKVAGIGTFLRIRNHRYPVSRPFVYLARIGYRPAPLLSRWPTEAIFGDFLQCGGAAPLGEWGAWPDIYRSHILAGPFYGWSGYYGTQGDGYNTMSRNVSHADFVKPETGGIRRLYTSNVDVAWGYQCEFASRPSYATSYKPYAGPDGAGKAYYWRYVGRAVTRPDLQTEPRPVIMWLADDTSQVVKGAYSTAVFVRDVYVVPVQQGPITAAVKPRDGTYKAIEKDGMLSWPKPGPGGRAIATGSIRNGSVHAAMSETCRESSIGAAWRVATARQLIEYIEEDKHILL